MSKNPKSPPARMRDYRVEAEHRAGRHSERTNCERTNCERKAMCVPDIEAAVEDYYRNVRISEHIVTALRELITAESTGSTPPRSRNATPTPRNATRSATNAATLLQAHDAGAVPLDLLATEQDRIARRLAFLDADQCRRHRVRAGQGPPGRLPRFGR